jgi:hypothetical protein
MAESTETEDQCYARAERAMGSILVAKGQEEPYDVWAERAMNSEQENATYGFSINNLVADMQTVIKTNNKKVPAHHRIRMIIWLGLLAQCWQEAEVCFVAATHCRRYVLTFL